MCRRALKFAMNINWNAKPLINCIVPLKVRVVDGVKVFVNLATKSLRGFYAVVFQFWFEKDNAA